MRARSFGLVFVMGSFLEKLRIYVEKFYPQSAAEESKSGGKTPGRVETFLELNFCVFSVKLCVGYIYFETMNNLFISTDQTTTK